MITACCWYTYLFADKDTSVLPRDGKRSETSQEASLRYFKDNFDFDLFLQTLFGFGKLFLHQLQVLHQDWGIRLFAAPVTESRVLASAAVV
jgi:hypothetical protein